MVADSRLGPNLENRNIGNPNQMHDVCDPIGSYVIVLDIYAASFIKIYQIGHETIQISEIEITDLAQICEIEISVVHIQMQVCDHVGYIFCKLHQDISNRS